MRLQFLLSFCHVDTTSHLGKWLQHLRDTASRLPTSLPAAPPLLLSSFQRRHSRCSAICDKMKCLSTLGQRRLLRRSWTVSRQSCRSNSLESCDLSRCIRRGQEGGAAHATSNGSLNPRRSMPDFWELVIPLVFCPCMCRHCPYASLTLLLHKSWL